MTDPLARLRRFLSELKRRNVYKVGVTYLVVAFVGLQAVDLLIPATTLPGWADELLLAFMVAGFPIALVLAWAFEMTPEGVRRTPHAEEPEEEAGETSTGARRATQILAALGLIAVAGAGIWQFTPLGGEDEAERASTPRIAVLPFENIARDTGDAFFARGMHEELLSQLSKVSGLEVISRTSVMGYANTDKRVPEISKELGGVDALMEGTVRRAGDQVRITTQLIEVPQDAHLWSNTYERELSPEAIFDIQADIAEQIAGALETELTGGERRRIEDAPTDDLAAYDAFLQGRSSYFQHWATREPADIRRSIENFREAVRRDASFAEAHAWLGLAYARRSVVKGGDRWVDSASVAVERARAIEPDLAAAHLAQGWIYDSRDSTSAGIASLRRALELQPSHGYAKSRLSDALETDGQYVEAVRVAREAVQLAPRQPAVLQEMSDQLAKVGFYDPAAAWARHILEIEPGDYEAIVGVAISHAVGGRFEEALATWQGYLGGTDAPTPFALLWAARAALQADQPERAKAYLERIPEARRQRLSEPVESSSELGLDDPVERAHLGLAELRLGNRERGRELLRQAADSVRAYLAEREASADTAWSFFRAQIGLAEVLAALGQRERALNQLEASESAVRRATDPFLYSPFFDDDLRSHPRFQKIVREGGARREEAREQIRQLGIDLYPPGVERDTASQAEGTSAPG